MQALRTAIALIISSLLLALSPWAQAQSLPFVRSFTVQQVSALTPGTELDFKVVGSAGAQVSLRIEGTERDLPLSEIKAGQYQGSYTIGRADKIDFNSGVEASLRLNGRETRAELAQTLLTTRAHTAAVQASLPTPVIDRFATATPYGLSGGDEILFELDGTPGGQAAATVAGSDATVALAEVKPGHYQGRYTIRSRDRVKPQSTARVTLALGSKSASAQKTVEAAAVQPTLAQRWTCQSCGVVTAIDTKETQGDATAVGTIAGGVAGAVLGNQVGKGDGRTVARVLGAVGGALAGREVEKRVRTGTQYLVTVKLNDGAAQVYTYNEDPGFKVGQHVKVDQGLLLNNE